jgi:hypothetical protein
LAINGKSLQAHRLSVAEGQAAVAATDRRCLKMTQSGPGMTGANWPASVDTALQRRSRTLGLVPIQVAFWKLLHACYRIIQHLREVEMARTKVFVSYSHKDADWLEKLQQHIALLRRLELVDPWADTRLEGGSEWEREIDVALTNAKVAVLLVSPAFLSSDFIWEKEMPRIEAHCREGMEALPLIIRACAWRLQPFLAKLTARPRDGNALSLMNNGEIDLELSKIAYELAAKVGKSPVTGSLASEVASPPAPISRQGSDDLTGTWNGFYSGTRQIQLVVQGQKAGLFHGKMEYPKEGIVTLVEGSVDRTWSPNDPVWRQIDRGKSELAVTFKETDYERKGSGAGVSLNGKYHGFVKGNQLSGAWFADTRLVGLFTLKRNASIS